MVYNRISTLFIANCSLINFNWIFMLRLFYFLLPIALLFFSFHREDDFKSAQLNYERVKKAYSEKEKTIKNLYQEKGINLSSQQIFLRAFKEEEELELWARSTSTDKFTLIKTYSICASSGILGPKRKQGDGQTPEGFYHIDRFNPQSAFYLSLGINYPNASDRILGNTNPGGDIFIHGNCVTIGCLPLTDNLIKEVYVAAVEARNNGQSKIPVHIFPFRMKEDQFTKFKARHSKDIALLHFWENLKAGYAYFEKNKTLPKVSIETNGKYSFK